MNITILTIGTRGDIEPYIALGAEMQKTGHSVVIATHDPYKDFILSYGLGFSPVAGDVEATLLSESMRQTVEQKGNMNRFFTKLKNEAEKHVEEALLNTIDACKEADHLMLTPLSLFLGWLAAKELRIKTSVASINPVGRTDTMPSIIFTRYRHLCPAYFQKIINSWSHMVVHYLSWFGQRPSLNKAWKNVFKKSLPLWEPLLKEFKKDPPLILYGYSASVLPKPHDWSDNQHIAGYWLVDTPDYHPPEALKTFLSSGSKPVFIGFGSMGYFSYKGKSLQEMIDNILTETGQRAILSDSSVADIEINTANTIARIKSVPFGWLFPQVAAAIHHGGAGTTALCLKAGIPMATTPMIYDQLFWGNLTHEKSIGPKPVPWSDLNEEKLKDAIKQLTENSAYARNAKIIASQLEKENGAKNAAEIFNRWYGAGS